MAAMQSSRSQSLLMTRRNFVELGLGVAALASAASLGAIEIASVSAVSHRPLALTSLDKAYLFLDQMMDLYAQGKTIRLMQSYVPTSALDLGDTGFTYDNAVALIAFLLRGQANDIVRATVLGDSLLYGQQHDPAADGRLRNSYHVNPHVLPNGQVNINDAGSTLGARGGSGYAIPRSFTAVGPIVLSAVRLGRCAPYAGGPPFGIK